MTLSPADQALKRDQRELVKAAGGQEAAVLFTTLKRHQSLSDFGNPNSDRHMPLHVVVALEEITHDVPGWPHITRSLCRRHGGEFVPLPAGKPDDRSWAQHLATLAKESSEVIAGLAQRLADGAIDAEDAQALLPEAEDLVRIACELRAAFQGAAEDTS